jgi:hypothetical protein
MNAVVNLTLEGDFLRGDGDLYNVWNNTMIIGNDSVTGINIRPHGMSDNNPDYHIKWENCNINYHFPNYFIFNPILDLEVINDTEPVVLSYYHGDELIGTIEVDPLHNNGITISGTKDVSAVENSKFILDHHLIYDNLDDINNVIHVNPIPIF